MPWLGRLTLYVYTWISMAYLLQLWEKSNIFLTRLRSVYTHTAGNPHCKGRLGTIDLLVLTSLNKLLVLKTLISIYKTGDLNEEVNRTEPFPLVSVPCTPTPNHLAAKIRK